MPDPDPMDVATTVGILFAEHGRSKAYAEAVKLIGAAMAVGDAEQAAHYTAVANRFKELRMVPPAVPNA